MIYVLDQSYLRVDELSQLIAAEPSAKFVIPNIAWTEMCQSQQWEATMLGSLKILSCIPGRVFQSLSIEEGLRYEAEHGESVKCHLLPRDLCNFTRGILRHIAQKDNEEALKILRKKILDVQPEMQQTFNHPRNKESLLKRTDIIKSALSDRQRLGEWRSENTSQEVRQQLIRQTSIDICSQYLKRQGFSTNRIHSFLKQQPLTLRYFYIHARHAANWVHKQGLSDMSAKKFSNDLRDQDYVLIGSFFDALLSKDKKVKKAEADLRAFLRKPA